MRYQKVWKHFCTITEHKWLVMVNCFRVGLFRQGLLHDMSKYSPEEFLIGVRYYQGDRSPNAAERDEKGFSTAWLHHKGRNKHHFEYWIDFSQDKEKGLVGHPMPVNYLVEMVMDRIAACRVYKGKAYTDSSALEYYEREKPYVKPLIYPDTARLLEKILVMLSREGERKTFRYMRRLLRNANAGEGRRRLQFAPVFGILCSGKRCSGKRCSGKRCSGKRCSGKRYCKEATGIGRQREEQQKYKQ